MAFSTFYINAPSLASATAVYSNATLTVLAADGYYSDGAIVRRQLSGVLLAPESCPQCDTTCPQTITINNTGQGLYKMSIDVTTAVGPILIRVDVSSLSDGFIAYYDGNPYNQLSSKNWGYVNNVTGVSPSPIDHPVWFGDSTDTGCSRGGVAAAVPVPCPPFGVGSCSDSVGQTTYNYDWASGTFVATGSSDWGNIPASHVQQNPSVPGQATCVIPKNTAGPSNVDVWMYGLCDNTGWSVEVDCPVALGQISTTGSGPTSIAACGSGVALDVFNAPVNGSPGVPGLYDWVYSDNTGNTLIGPGANVFYKYVDGGINKWFEVSTDSIIINMGTC
tara:strand:+ start:108 stop:1109 length:1002 start_codon:yes stop_codon:yes gene_type:complete